MYVLKHDGSRGWRRAQEVEVIAGCAGLVIGAIWASCGGSEESLPAAPLPPGKRIGEVKGGQLSLLNSPNASTIVNVFGHGTAASVG